MRRLKCCEHELNRHIGQANIHLRINRSPEKGRKILPTGRGQLAAWGHWSSKIGRMPACCFSRWGIHRYVIAFAQLNVPCTQSAVLLATQFVRLVRFNNWIIDLRATTYRLALDQIHRIMRVNQTLSDRMSDRSYHQTLKWKTISTDAKKAQLNEPASCVWKFAVALSCLQKIRPYTNIE